MLAPPLASVNLFRIVAQALYQNRATTPSLTSHFTSLSEKHFSMISVTPWRILLSGSSTRRPREPLAYTERYDYADGLLQPGGNRWMTNEFTRTAPSSPGP